MATGREQFIVDAKGNRTGVVLSWRRYQKPIEELHDLAIITERRHEKPIPLSEFKRRLKAHGIL